MDRQVKGIWIPIAIWQTKDLSWNEKILLMEIDSYTSKNIDCFFSNEYIAELLNVTECTANRILSSLIQKGYVRKTRFDGRRRFVESTLIKQGCLDEIINAALSKKSKQTCHLEQHNNKELINKSNKQEDIDNISSVHRAKFVKPTLEEVAAFCESRHNGINPQRFWSHYESNGWRVGRNKMQDWRQAVITWENSEFNAPASAKKETSPAKKESTFEYNMRQVDKMFGTNYHEQLYGKKEDTDEQ